MLTKVISLRELSPSTFVLRLEKNGFYFQPGQCVNLGVRGSGVNREYSTYSGANDPFLEFLIKEVKGGTVSPALKRVQAGDEVDLHGPYGSFVIDPSRIKGSRFVFIGTGTGIAPFHAFTRSYPDLDYEIVVGVRTASEKYDFDDFASDRLTCCVSRESWNGFQGRVTDYLKQMDVDTAAFYYLCGNQAMIHDVYDLLRQKEVSGDHIVTEAFF